MGGKNFITVVEGEEVTDFKEDIKDTPKREIKVDYKELAEMDMNKLKKVFKLNQEQFPGENELHGFLLFEIQKHLVEINDLLDKKDNHYRKEMADLTILTHMLACCNDADSKIFGERLEKFKSKVKENINKQ